MSIRINLDEVAPVDSTRVVVGPSKHPATAKDSKAWNDAYDRSTRANAEAAYSVLRFTPYVKYITDVGDILGVNPAAYGKPGEYDPTDGMAIGGQGLEAAFNHLADEEAKGGSYTTTIYRGRNKRKVVLQRGGPDGWQTKAYRYAAKYNPLKMGAILGDVVQGIKAAKEAYNANRHLTNTEQSINWTQQPFKIDTGVSRKTNERFNVTTSKRSVRKLGGLSRSDDYGSSKKPYPNVKSSDFAGGGRSYPIPTRADAVDALRLAGLHGRSDVRAKVYKKYPDLKK